MLIQPAVPASSSLRHAVAAWLSAVEWPAVDVDDIRLAVNEAVANVIDHAYLNHDLGPIHLHAWTNSVDPAVVSAGSPWSPVPSTPMPGASAGDRPSGSASRESVASTGAAAAAIRSVTVVVSDRGRWTPERRTVDPRGHRGHGLAVMTASMAQVHVPRAQDGTTVVMVSQPLPVPEPD